MSNLGKKEIQIPENIKVFFNENALEIIGPLGQKKLEVPAFLEVILSKESIKIFPKDMGNLDKRALWGTFRSVLQNTILGLSQGYQVTLKLVGVGYRGSVEGDRLVFKLGFSHLVSLTIPKGVHVRCVKSFITLRSCDKELVTQYAAYIRSHKLPEPYKGKGILYKKEKIRRKEGKKK